MVVDTSIGIIMVTARDQVGDVTQAYLSGADIYFAKPVSPEELGAAILALSRRIRPSDRGRELVLNRLTLRLQGPIGAIDVSDHECLLLSALAKAKGQRLETWQIFELGSKAAEGFTKGALEVQIVRLRKKLERVGAPTPTIKAIRGIGYQLCVQLEMSQTGS
jgi:DNA-binding response OmpR family regulator